MEFYSTGIGHSYRPETVLLVEDERMVRHFICRILRKSNYTVLEASRPDEALRIAMEYPEAIHAVVTDIVLPGMDGLELAKCLRRERPFLKLLLTSGFYEDAELNLEELGPDAIFLAKPFEPETLIRKLREAIDAS